jgi:AraC-like DNA-binding protein
MVDPLADVVTLLQPGAPYTKVASGAGVWSVRRGETGSPFYCAVLDGAARLEAGCAAPMTLIAGDFVLVPASCGFVMSNAEPGTAVGSGPIATSPDDVRHGDPDAPVDVRLLVGHFSFASPDAAMLVALLPKVIHVRGEPRLAAIGRLVGDEARANRPARSVVLERLLEVMLIEALRSTAGTTASPGLVRGLADGRLAAALRAMHETPERAWTVAELARTAALSRSVFFTRFSEAVGMAPMAYLMAWRMALAKRLIGRGNIGIAEVAARVGYASASAFSVAFSRFVGVPPSLYGREPAENDGLEPAIAARAS